MIKRMGILAALFMFLGVMLVAGNEDVNEAEKQQKRCDEMLDIWQSTSGQFGWPNCGVNNE